MITAVAIKSFKCLRSVRLDLERFTVFVGPNASGKSSVLEALHLLCTSFQSQNADIANELWTKRTRGETDFVEVSAQVEEKALRYRITDSAKPSGRGAQWNGDRRGVASDLDADDWKPWNAASAADRPLPASELLRFEVSNLVRSDAAQGDPPRMSPQGIGMHAALASMALNDPDSWRDLQSDLRRIVPTIQRLRHTATQINRNPALIFDTVGATSVEASHMSEGTLLALGLLATLHASPRPELLLLDDLDRGLHPRAQKDLMTLLRGLLEANPRLQILASTHSPYLLDHLNPREVRLTMLRDDGSTVCAPLTSHPDFEEWKDEMTPGEIWSMFGEAWVAEHEAAR